MWGSTSTMHVARLVFKNCYIVVLGMARGSLQGEKHEMCSVAGPETFYYLLF